MNSIALKMLKHLQILPKFKVYWNKDLKVLCLFSYNMFFLNFKYLFFYERLRSTCKYYKYTYNKYYKYTIATYCLTIKIFRIACITLYNLHPIQQSFKGPTVFRWLIQERFKFYGVNSFYPKCSLIYFSLLSYCAFYAADFRILLNESILFASTSNCVPNL